MISVGDSAPDFTLDCDANGPISLSSYRGRKVVLYFYPKDFTPVCTRQACDFTEALPSFDALGAAVVGVSADDIASHRAFRSELGVSFPLLADIGGRVSDAFGVWGERDVDGRTLMGIERSTFLIDESGTVEQLWRGVDAEGHIEALTDYLGGLGESG